MIDFDVSGSKNFMALPAIKFSFLAVVDGLVEISLPSSLLVVLPILLCSKEWLRGGGTGLARPRKYEIKGYVFDTSQFGILAF